MLPLISYRKNTNSIFSNSFTGLSLHNSPHLSQIHTHFTPFPSHSLLKCSQTQSIIYTTPNISKSSTTKIIRHWSHFLTKLLPINNKILKMRMNNQLSNSSSMPIAHGPQLFINNSSCYYKIKRTSSYMIKYCLLNSPLILN